MGNALPRVDSYSDQSHSLAGLAEDPLTSYSFNLLGGETKERTMILLVVDLRTADWMECGVWVEVTGTKSF